MRLTVYHMPGRRVAVLVDEVLPAGWHSVEFDAGRLSSGVYVYRLDVGGRVLTRKMTVV